MTNIKALDITAETWGMTNTSQGHCFVSPKGEACPVNIVKHGHGKYSSGFNRITTKDYPDGVYEVVVYNEAVEDIVFYPPEGGREKIQPVLAPEAVQKFAVAFAKEADCYHCKCLEEHLQNATKVAKLKSAPFISV